MDAELFQLSISPVCTASLIDKLDVLLKAVRPDSVQWTATSPAWQYMGGKHMCIMVYTSAEVVTVAVGYAIAFNDR